jgi:hypothetical protein
MQFEIHIYHFFVKIYVGFVVDIDIKILRVPPPPPGAGHAFPKQRHMCRRRGYLFLRGFSSLYDAIHGWMMRWMDRWMDGSHDEKSFTM